MPDKQINKVAKVSDRGRLTIATISFGMALGTTAVAFPLLALDSGLSATVVGLLAALSAAIQMVTKMTMPYLLSRVTDRSVMSWSLTIISLSAATLLFTTAGFAFVTAQLLQGIARGLFWTCSQTHVVRSADNHTRQLAYVHTIGQLGTLTGPVVAGTLAAISLYASLAAGCLIALVGLVFALALHRLPPYERAPKATRKPIWRRGGTGLGAWGGAAAGAWRGILDSFVPVILASGGLSASAIGWLMSSSDGAGLAATAWVARWGTARVGRFIPYTTLFLGMAIIALPWADSTVALGLILAVAGAGGGVSGVLGMAAINRAVEQSEQGAAIALVGVYRAGARSAAPAFIGTMVAFATMPLAMAVAGLAVVAPGLWVRLGKT